VYFKKKKNPFILNKEISYNKARRSSLAATKTLKYLKFHEIISANIIKNFNHANFKYLLT